MKTQKPPTLQQLFDQIRAIQAADTLRDNDLTIKRVMAEFKWGKSKAKRYLTILVKKGAVKEESIVGNGGKQTKVWRAK